MKINWKVRFKNKTWLSTFIVGVVALIYQILGIVGVVPALSQELVISVIAAIVNILVMLGIVVDPTTEGINDSTQALTYDKPKSSKEEN